MDNLILISAQPQDFQYSWQIDVQCWNFRELGILDKYHILVGYTQDYNLQEWLRLQTKYKEAKFFFYKDERSDLTYIPSVRPHILKKHFEQFQDLKNKVVFYLDSDVIFRELPDLKFLSEGDICWQSNTSSYLDYNYLKQKEVHGSMPDDTIVNRMAEIGGISKEIIKDYAGKTGGAQYILKGVDAGFWQEVETMCTEIYKSFAHKSRAGLSDSVNSLYFMNEESGLQSWCADMWAVNFCLWKRGKVTDIHKEMEFTWATDENKKWFENKIYHDAGAGKKGMFRKNLWKDKSPVGKNISVLSAYANWHYVEAIKKVK